MRTFIKHHYLGASSAKQIKSSLKASQAVIFVTCNISCIQSHIRFLILIRAYRHGVREAGVVDAGTKRLLGQAGLKQAQGLNHLLVEVLHRLVGHLKVQVVGIKPGGTE